MKSWKLPLCEGRAMLFAAKFLILSLLVSVVPVMNEVIEDGRSAQVQDSSIKEKIQPLNAAEIGQEIKPETRDYEKYENNEHQPQNENQEKPLTYVKEDHELLSKTENHGNELKNQLLIKVPHHEVKHKNQILTLIKEDHKVEEYFQNAVQENQEIDSDLKPIGRSLAPRTLCDQLKPNNGVRKGFDKLKHKVSRKSQPTIEEEILTPEKPLNFRSPSFQPESPPTTPPRPPKFKSPGPNAEEFSVEDNIKSIVMVGSGEFVYDTKIQRRKPFTRKTRNVDFLFGAAEKINQHSDSPKSDAVLSLDQLEEDLPNVEWISVVVYWYASDTQIHKCKLYPAVDENEYVTTEDWKVDVRTREHAQQVSKDGVKHGGTVSDAALIRYIQKLHQRGFKVMLYPKILLAENNKQWRGKFTSPEIFSLHSFFSQYKNIFIKHYSEIAKKTNVEGFIIGSGMGYLTRYKNLVENYSVVTHLVGLANQVKALLGKDVIVTYAADWNEYHSYKQWYYMDELWASPSIDVVGINAYFPLTDGVEPSSGYSVQDIIDGWTKGEGYNYFYSPYEREGRIGFSDRKWAWKNIEKWWGKAHTNPDGEETDWRPKMKPIWFTEFGFASVDGCTNEPGVFVESEGKERTYPRYSSKEVSFRSQKVATEGFLKKWENSEMVERMFLYAWDARPFPQFPNLCKVWPDCSDWETAHWIQGKIGKKVGSRPKTIVARRFNSGSESESSNPDGEPPSVVIALRDYCRSSHRLH